MLITRETDYAVRILRALADRERHNMTELCDSEAVPRQFAYKIIHKLAEAELVRSVRGVNGGVQLISDLRNLSLLDVIQITESDARISDCMDPSYLCNWTQKNCKACAVHSRLCEIQQQINEELRKISLHDLLSVRDTSNIE